MSEDAISAPSIGEWSIQERISPYLLARKIIGEEAFCKLKEAGLNVQYEFWFERKRLDAIREAMTFPIPEADQSDVDFCIETLGQQITKAHDYLNSKGFGHNIDDPTRRYGVIR